MYKKELALKLWMYQQMQKITISLPTDLRFLEIMGRSSHTVSGTNNFASPPLNLMMKCGLIKCESVLSFQFMFIVLSNKDKKLHNFPFKSKFVR